MAILREPCDSAIQGIFITWNIFHVFFPHPFVSSSDRASDGRPLDVPSVRVKIKSGPISGRHQIRRLDFCVVYLLGLVTGPDGSNLHGFIEMQSIGLLIIGYYGLPSRALFGRKMAGTRKHVPDCYPCNHQPKGVAWKHEKQGCIVELTVLVPPSDEQVPYVVWMVTEITERWLHCR